MKLPIIKQKVLLPQELEVWYILPAIRKAFAIEMINAGLSQKKVASILGVTGAAVSHYKKQKRAQDIKFNDEVQESIKASAKEIIENPQHIFREIMKTSKFLKQSGIFCQLHRSKSITPVNCEDVCEKYLEIPKIHHTDSLC